MSYCTSSFTILSFSLVVSYAHNHISWLNISANKDDAFMKSRKTDGTVKASYSRQAKPES